MKCINLKNKKKLNVSLINTKIKSLRPFTKELTMKNILDIERIEIIYKIRKSKL